MDETVPDHSTLSQLRRRKFNDSRIFEDIFDEIVKKCIEIGLVTGETLLTDSTHLRANAANDKRETVTVKRRTSEYMRKLDEAALAEGLIKELPEPKEEDKEVTKSIIGPDCGLMNRLGKPTGFHYLNHQTIDGNSGIITDVHVTPAKTNFPTDDSLKKSIYLSIKEISKKWNQPIQNWGITAGQFIMFYEDRFAA